MCDLDQQIAAARLELMEGELRRFKEPKKAESFWSNPLLLAIAGATATAIVGLLTSKSQIDANRRLERDKLESSLVLKAIDTGDPAERLVALQFLVKAGLISDTEGKIAALEADEIPRIQENAREESIFSQHKDLPIQYSRDIVNRILKNPAVPYPAGVTLVEPTDQSIKAIVLHYSYGPDNVEVIKTGRPPDLPGPLAHWVVLSDGSIEFIAPEGKSAAHLGRASRELRNSNTIGVETTGQIAFADERQVENLVRLVADIADRWSIPTEMIVSHAEVAFPLGRKMDMRQQAPEIRKMVEAIRKGTELQRQHR